ncbi:MAG: shikimate kinase [Phycisphaerae bacterium]|nr:shikimate kinase [Phycisphaerae bacterium]
MTSRLRERDNIVLIGMPGVGKSTVGVLLAKVTSLDFIDTDVYIQARLGRRLQEIIDANGREEFLRTEEAEVLTLNCRDFVIATGGSVIYSQAAMAHLKRRGLAVHLDLPFDRLEKRLTNLLTRGVVMPPGYSLAQLYDERQPLYRRHADVTIDCNGLDHQQVVDCILRTLEIG